MNFRVATPADHDEIFKIAKTSKYTRDFSNRVMFSSDAAYEKGWIRVVQSMAVEGLVPDALLGFTCVRHKIRVPKTMLYFIAVHPDMRGMNLGRSMLEDVMANSPHKTMELNVMKDNEAVKFYERLGFHVVGDAMKGEAWRMERTWS